MINGATLLPTGRFIATLKIVYKEGVHLSFSWQRLFSNKIDASWVQNLEKEPEVAEQLEAFISRFGRMQDTIANNLQAVWPINILQESSFLLWAA